MLEYYDKKLPIVEARLQASGKKFIGGTDRPTIADFKVFAVDTYITSDTNSACMLPEDLQAQMKAKRQASPLYEAWYQAMKSEMGQYLAERPPRPL